MLANYPPFLPIPEKIARRARAMFGNRNIYLTIGNPIDELFSDLFSEISWSKNDGSPLESKYLLSLISAIQYEEELPDLQFIEALRARIDIKYALHLPENYPGLDFVWLSGLRKQLSAAPQKMESFQKFLDRLKYMGLFCRNDGKPYDAETVIKTLMISSLMERVVQSMYMLLEELAIEDANWLRSIILPQWYERYNRNRPIIFWPNFNNNWRAFPQAIGKDLQYLIEKIDKPPINISEGLPTVLILKQAWDDLYQAMDQN